MKPYLFILSLLVIFGCNKGQKHDNMAPETFISVNDINLTGDDRLNSTVHLKWSGKDQDGYVEFFDISIDAGTNWYRTKQLDSIFIFSISAGSDTLDIEFQVRAVDQAGLEDPTPATLIVPIKNTPPTVVFKGDLMPQDTIHSVASISWTASDFDGSETIEKVEVRLNEGTWYEVDKQVSFLSIIPVDPEATGEVNGYVYYGSKDPETITIDGLQSEGLNTVYVRVTDIAGSESETDTSESFFLKSKKSDLLVIGANPSGDAFYRGNLDVVYPNYDYINYYSESGKNQPKFWNPTFNLLVKLYDKLLFYTENSLFEDAQTKQQRLILESAAPALQEYLDAGGKSMISAIFPNDFSETSSLFQTLPMERLSDAIGGTAILGTDSLVVPDPVGYDTLRPSSFLTGLDPFYITADAEVFYRGHIEIVLPWQGPDIIGARRVRDGNVVQIFFSVEMHKLNGDPAAMTSLFDQIFKTDFNW